MHLAAILFLGFLSIKATAMDQDIDLECAKTTKRNFFLKVSTTHEDFLYPLRNAEINLIYSFNFDLFLRYLAAPLLKQHAIELKSWKITTPQAIFFRKNGEPQSDSKLVLGKRDLSAKELVELINHHIETSYLIPNAIATPSNTVFLATKQPLPLKQIFNNLLRYYLAILSLTIPKQEYEVNYASTRLNYFRLEDCMSGGMAKY